MPRPAPILLATLLLSALLSTPLSAQTRPPTGSRSFDVGTIVGEFLRDYDAAVANFTTFDFALRGRVEKVNIRKATDGHTLVTLSLLSRDPPDGTPMIPIWIDFPDTMESQVSKLKPGDQIQVDVTFGGGPAPAPLIHELRGFMGEKITSLAPDPKLEKLKSDLVAWVRKSNTVRPDPENPDNKLVRDMTAKITASINRGDDFSITFGARLMQSGKAAILSVQDDKMFERDLTPDQIAALKISPTATTHTPIASSALRMPAEIIISNFTLDTNSAWNLSKPLTGKITVKEIIRHDKTPADYGIRLVSYAGQKRSVFFSSFQGLPGNTSHPFRFTALASEITDLDLANGPLPRLAYIEVVRRTGDNPKGGTPKAKPTPLDEIISEPVDLLLTMSAK